MGLPGQESQDGTVRTVLPGNDRITRTGESGQDNQDRTTKTKELWKNLHSAIFFFLQPIEMFAAETVSYK
jgi:hypothetical protein